MTESEAIELIEKDLKLHSKDLSSKYKNGLRMAIKALEKQIKKKPIADKLLNEYYECPVCRDCVGVGRYLDEYCPNCGQAIDWND